MCKVAYLLPCRMALQRWNRPELLMLAPAHARKQLVQSGERSSLLRSQSVAVRSDPQPLVEIQRQFVRDTHERREKTLLCGGWRRKRLKRPL